jgi:hypothetical protein
MGSGVCAICGGTGSILGKGTVAQRKYAIGQALKRYQTLQQGRKYAQIGEAWVPQVLAPKLSARQQVVLRRATAAPCRACQGLGMADCTACKGAGKMRCTNRGCVNGSITVTADPSSRGSSRLLGRSLDQVRKCQMCKGTGFIACLPCRGTGAMLCTACNGTLERVACVRCAGEGSARCQKCGGEGKVKEVPCAVCGAEGIVLCATCNGDGKKP